MINKYSQIILGLDPGLANLGYGVIRKEGNQLTFLNAGVIKTSKKQGLTQRLLMIHKQLIKIIKKYKIDSLAIEELFFAKNVKTASVIGQVIGSLILTAALKKLVVYQFTPLEIKQTLTSYGRAEKSQLALIVKLILRLKTDLIPHHATDALACAICCAQKSPWTKN